MPRPDGEQRPKSSAGLSEHLTLLTEIPGRKTIRKISPARPAGMQRAGLTQRRAPFTVLPDQRQRRQDQEPDRGDRRVLYDSRGGNRGGAG